MAMAESVKKKILGLIEKANEATGNEDTNLTSAVGSLVEGYGQGGKEPVMEELVVTEDGEYLPGDGIDGFSKVTMDAGIYCSKRGQLYRRNTVLTFETEMTILQHQYANCEYLETFTAEGVPMLGAAASFRYYLSYCPLLHTAKLHNWTSGCAALTFTDTPSLRHVIFGAVGTPVTALQGLWMRDCNANGVEVTVYVDANSIAEIPTSITNNVLGGRSDAVVIYRSSTTGEVIEA